MKTSFTPVRSRSLQLLTAAACALVLLVVAGCGGTPASGVAPLPAGVVATVDGTAVTEAELEARMDTGRAQAKAQGQEFPAAGEDGYSEARRQALQTIIQELIVTKEAAQCGEPCAVADDEVTAQMKQIRTESFEGSQPRFAAALKEQGLTPAQARRIVRLQLQQERLAAQVTEQITFSTAEARSFYEENPEQFEVTAGRQVSHILVATEAEARRVRAGLNAANFAERAERFSTDPGSREQGGALGVLTEGQTVPEFEKAAFALADGEISGPVKTNFGWHIIRAELVSARTVPFAEAEQEIITNQLQSLRQEAVTAYQARISEEYEARTVYSSPELAPLAATSATTTP